MIKPRELNELGLPNDPRLMAPAMRLINSTLGRSRAGEAEHEAMREAVRTLAVVPESMCEHPVLGPLARLYMELFPAGTQFIPMRMPSVRWKRPAPCLRRCAVRLCRMRILATVCP